MSDILGTRRSHGRTRAGSATPINTPTKIPSLPNFREVSRYIDFVSVEIENLSAQEGSDESNFCIFNIEDLIRKCNLNIENIRHLVSSITRNGDHGILEKDGVTLHLTKEGLSNLLHYLDGKTLETCLKNNLLDESDFEGGKANISSPWLRQIMRQRGFEILTGESSQKLVNSIFAILEEGTHYTPLPQIYKNKSSGIKLLPIGIEELVARMNWNVIISILPRHLPENHNLSETIL